MNAFHALAIQISTLTFDFASIKVYPSITMYILRVVWCHTFSSFSTKVLLFCAMAVGVTSVDSLRVRSPSNNSGGQSFTCHFAFLMRFRLFVLKEIIFVHSIFLILISYSLFSYFLIYLSSKKRTQYDRQVDTSKE